MVLLSSGQAPTSGESRVPVSTKLRQVLLTGAALTIPLLITVMILAFVVNFMLRTIRPAVTFVTARYGIGADLPSYLMETLAVFTLVALVFVVGLVAETRSGDELERVFDTAMARIPGVGSLYTSFNEMTDLLLSNDTQSFREVKLVEFPHSESYSIAFVTANSPPTIGDATGHDGMMTLFMPLAPNPVMGGYVVHVPQDRVYDIDMTVEEGIQSIVTSGVATGDSDSKEYSGQLVDFQTIREQARDGVEGLGAWGSRTVDDLIRITVDSFTAADVFGSSDTRNRDFILTGGKKTTIIRMSDITGDAAGDIREQAYREFAAIHPDLDESAVDDEEAVRHYMLEEFEDGDGRESTSGSSPTNGDAPDSSRPDGERSSPDGDDSTRGDSSTDVSDGATTRDRDTGPDGDDA